MGRSSWHTEKNHSTETALLTVHNDIIRGIASHKDVIFILLDLSAAFDTVNHQILLQRLRDRFGICNTALDWFTSHITDCKQYVAIGDTISESHTLDCGFPQGQFWGRSSSLCILPLLKTSYDRTVFKV